MHIITTIYFAEISELTDSARIDVQAEAWQAARPERQWVSIYEGKNRVEPIDQNE